MTFVGQKMSHAMCDPNSQPPEPYQMLQHSLQIHREFLGSKPITMQNKTT